MPQLVSVLALGSAASICSALIILAIPKSILAALAKPLSLMAIGLLLSISIAHLIPESMEKVDSHHIGLVMLLTLVVLTSVEMLLNYLAHREAEAKKAAGERLAADHVAASGGGVSLLTATFLHNISDGVMLASTFMIDPKLGVALTLAIVLHEIPQELSSFGALIDLGLDKRGAMSVNLAAFFGAVTGVSVGYLVLDKAAVLIPYAVGVAAASFIYVALVDFLPRLNRTALKRVIFWRMVFILFGVAVGLCVSHH